MNDFIIIASIALKSSIAVLLASIGEIFTERSGILNLGVEGMMLVGAMTGFVVGYQTHSFAWAFTGAMLAGALLASLHAVLAIGLKVNQVISGLGITILGMGLSNFLGRPFIGRVGLRMEPISVEFLSDLPVLGPILVQQSALAMCALLIVPLAWYGLFHTSIGLKIRAVGEDPVAANAAGVNVYLSRYGATIAGGVLAGLAGAYLSVVYTPGWKENMTGGQGWIAIAMVIFSGWNPLGALLGALLFGGLNALQFYSQAVGKDLIPAYMLQLMPYLLTVLILLCSSALKSGSRRKAPRALGLPFHCED
jgi:simple sugar transport system permease protein